MEEHKSRGDFSSVEPCSGLLKPSRPLDVKHEIATIHKLHDKEQTVLAMKEINSRTCNEPFYYTVYLDTDIIKEDIIV